MDTPSVLTLKLCQSLPCCTARRFPNKLFHQQNSLQLLNTHILKHYRNRTSRQMVLMSTSRLIKSHNERLSVRENFLEQEEAKDELKIEAKMHGMHPRVCSCGKFK